MNKKCNKLIILIFLILIAFLTACSKNKKPVDLDDGGLLSDKPCSAPCFQNITPGISTKDDAIKKFSALGFQNDCKFFDNLSKGGSKSFFCKNIGVSLNKNDIVLSINYSPIQKFSLENIIQKFGEPDCYSLTSLGVDDSKPYIMSLFFDKAFLVVFLPGQDGGIYDVTEQNEIDRFILFEKDFYNEYKILCEPWKGYGEYK